MNTGTFSLSFPTGSPVLGLEQTPRKHVYYELRAVSRGSSPEAQRGVAVCRRRPSEVGPSRNFPWEG